MNRRLWTAGVAALGLVAWLLVRQRRCRAVRRNLQTRSARPTPPGDLRASVVVPAYREPGIAESVVAIRRALDDLERNGGLEILVVDDGSGDGTAELAEGAGADRVIVQPVNCGKGAAVRAGMLAARGRAVAFTDADLSYSPDQIRLLIDQVEAGWDVVVGSRRHDDTTTVVRAGRLRELGGRGINLATRAVLVGRHRDTQCGLKAFRSDAARLVFSHARVNGFAFDVEVFSLVERYGLSLAEVPVQVVNTQHSSVRVLPDALRLVSDLARIRARGALGDYDLDPREALSAVEDDRGPTGEPWGPLAAPN